MNYNNYHQISNKFNKVAAQYLNNTSIQNITAKHIIKNLISGHIKHNTVILDLGSGPGTLLHTKSDIPVISYDISMNMLKHGKNIRHNNAICGDATALPFADASIECIISNLMVQWVTDKYTLFKEMSRILKPQGQIIFTTLIKPSLWQLQHIWQNIDTHPHTLIFDEFDEYKIACSKNNLSIINSEIFTYNLYFDSYID